MIVVIGNGTSAIGRGLGAQIDSAERVVRFNHFRLEGFNKDLGTKITDHMHIHGAKHLWAGVKKWAVASPKDFAYLVQDPEINNRDIVPLEMLQEIIVEAKLGVGVHASTGLVGIFLALRWGDDVAITNFDFAVTGHYWEMGHLHSKNHNWAAEKLYVQLLKKTGRITVLDGVRH